MSSNKPLTHLLGLAILIAVTGCGGSSSDSENPDAAQTEASIKLAYVTNGIASFWDVAKAGADAGAEEFSCKVEVRMPDGALDQKETLEDLLSQGIDGIAVSPIDPENQTTFLNKLGENTLFITHDSDAPKSNRRYYVGMDNYDAGRLCGQLVKEAIPDGGEILITVGRLEQLNAKLRRQGVIDELLDRERQEDYYDDQDGVIKGDKYTIVATKTDGFDTVRAKEQAQDALVQYPELKCMVGLFAYNSPACIDAIKEADKLGQIKICGFDEQDALLQAITDGHAYGTISQLPWEYGYESIKMLKDIYEGNKPSTEYVEKSFAAVTKENVAEFWAKKKEMAELGKSK